MATSKTNQGSAAEGSQGDQGNFGRREVLGAALVAATAAGSSACAPRKQVTSQVKERETAMSRPDSRMPVAFVAHGGGPYPILDLGFPQDERTSLLKHMRDVGQVAGTTPKALLVVSAHWEAPVPTVLSSAKPPLLYDYSGFPPEAYTLTWPAPGNPTLASRVRGLLAAASFATAEDAERGFDHGTFIPLKVAYPEADIPVVQLSLIQGLDPNEHLKMGRALAPLREEGVFIIGSGNSFHNMGAFRSQMQGSSVAGAQDRAAKFDDWLRSAVAAAPTARDEQLRGWAQAPFGRFAHPREEHLVPLMVVAGAAGADPGVTTWTGSLAGLTISAFRFG
jgi:aromatic ring-opening dioxygenase catalytic subunit (LigB family)